LLQIALSVRSSTLLDQSLFVSTNTHSLKTKKEIGMKRIWTLFRWKTNSKQPKLDVWHSTRLMVLFWYHDHCVVLICMFLGNNLEINWCILRCLHGILQGYSALVGFPTAMSFFYSHIEPVLLATGKWHSMVATTGYCIWKWLL